MVKIRPFTPSKNDLQLFEYIRLLMYDPLTEIAYSPLRDVVACEMDNDGFCNAEYTDLYDLLGRLEDNGIINEHESEMVLSTLFKVEHHLIEKSYFYGFRAGRGDFMHLVPRLRRRLYIIKTDFIYWYTYTRYVLHCFRGDTASFDALKTAKDMCLAQQQKYNWRNDIYTWGDYEKNLKPRQHTPRGGIDNG